MNEYETATAIPLLASQGRAAVERTWHQAPDSAGPFGTYVEAVQTGNLLFFEWDASH
jgi:hypothetical protein